MAKITDNLHKREADMYRLIFIIILFSFHLHAATMLSGDIGGRTFAPSGNPFIVRDNITVPPGKAAVIKAGCVFLFRPFTGIVIDGGLSAEGTSQSPVVFTSIFDEKYATNAKEPAKQFDWNGIYISPRLEPCLSE